MKKTKKVCTECGKLDYYFSRKRCKFCAMKSYKKPKKVSDKQKAKKKEVSDLRDVYFDYHINRCTHSEETGEVIYNPWRGNICHLICKGRHPSVQDNLDNYIYLTLDQHTLLDSHLFKNEFDKIAEKLPNSWKIICERLKLVLPLVQEKTKFIHKLTEYLENEEKSKRTYRKFS